MEKKKTSTIWKPISIGSTSAIVFVMGSSLLGTEKNTAQPATLEQPTARDEESFRQAFAEARSQKGSHASFEWRGNSYSTATKEEWESLSEDQQEEIVERVAVSLPVDVSASADAVEVVEAPQVAEVSDDLDVSVLDEEDAEADVAVLDEPVDAEPQLVANAIEEDDFGDDDVRMIGMDSAWDDDSYVALGDGSQDVYVINLDDVGGSEEEDDLSVEPVEVDVDIAIDQQIDLSREVDYEEPQPEEDGLMGEGVDSYFA
ncbi:MAG: hypothetical protein J5867_08200 [Prevotella sp.]|nr:hypothetical protein [Prevotella sp.]